MKHFSMFLIELNFTVFTHFKKNKKIKNCIHSFQAVYFRLLHTRWIIHLVKKLWCYSILYHLWLCNHIFNIHLPIHQAERARQLKKEHHEELQQRIEKLHDINAKRTEIEVNFFFLKHISVSLLLPEVIISFRPFDCPKHIILHVRPCRYAFVVFRGCVFTSI